MNTKRKLIVAFPAFEASISLVFAYRHSNLGMGFAGLVLLAAAIALHRKFRRTIKQPPTVHKDSLMHPQVENSLVQLALLRCSTFAGAIWRA